MREGGDLSTSIQERRSREGLGKGNCKLWVAWVLRYRDHEQVTEGRLESPVTC